MDGVHGWVIKTEAAESTGNLKIRPWGQFFPEAVASASENGRQKELNAWSKQWNNPCPFKISL
jgi:hypothetical protein